jgi:energy-coupling factor transporter ATP-binding protein EcfA2
MPMETTLQQLFIQAVIHSETSTEKLKQLHDRDVLARWFKIGQSRPHPTLRVYDRFGPLCDPGRSGNSKTTNTFPSFVSFIGKSGAGKSTLVRAMILLGMLKHPGLLANNDGSNNSSNLDQIEAFTKILSSHREVPATRSGNIEHLTDPTTLGVHLYQDGRGSSASQGAQDSFILFADCEGFFAGPAQTNAERLTSPEGGSSPSQEAPANLLYQAEVTAPSYTQEGQHSVELFYARFLYAISDVVIFVTNEDQTIKQGIMNVLEWAAAAVFNSVNNPSRKTLIVVRNMALGHNRELYGDGFLAKLYLDNATNLWEHSDKLMKFVTEYNSRQDQFGKHIYENRDLYNVLFDDIICCCIPHVKDVEGQYDDELFKQYQQLRTRIDGASQRARSLRSRSWMQYNVPSLSHILLKAFEHFRASDKPFDFYKAARKDSPNPQSSSNHIANFLRLAFDSDCDPMKIKEMIPAVIALSFITWFVRNLSHGK